MIPSHLLHRLLLSIARSIVTNLDPDAGELDDDDRDDQRTALVTFARDYKLDLQDLATLVRIAAGEGPEELPVFTTRHELVDEPGVLRR